MTESELKDFLDSFVDGTERNFEVVFSPRRPRRRQGSYNANLRRIRIYPEVSRQPMDLIATGLHELAHHLAWERGGAALAATLRETKRFPAHGYVFKAVLFGLVESFDARYAERFHGFLVLEKGEARYGPEFVEFSDGPAEESIIDYRTVVRIYSAIFGWRPKTSSTVYGSPLTRFEAPAPKTPQNGGLPMKSYAQFFGTRGGAYTAHVRKNRVRSPANRQLGIECLYSVRLIEGPKDSLAVVDVNTAIEMGVAYEWNT